MTYRLRFAPLVWAGPVTPHPRPTPFRARWEQTVEALSVELEHLKADPGSVTLAVDASPTDIRLDGQLRANAKVATRFVILSFTSGRWGPMSYPCDTYESRWSGQMPSWQANTRAIALGLEALRAVERHGIADRGEQYVGYRQIGAGTAPTPTAMTTEDAARLLLTESGAGADFSMPFLAEAVAETIRSAAATERLFRRAARRLHPDVGGDPARFRRIVEARDLLAAHQRHL